MCCFMIMLQANKSYLSIYPDEINIQITSRKRTPLMEYILKERVDNIDCLLSKVYKCSITLRVYTR